MGRGGSIGVPAGGTDATGWVDPPNDPRSTPVSAAVNQAPTPQAASASTPATIIRDEGLKRPAARVAGAVAAGADVSGSNRTSTGGSAAEAELPGSVRPVGLDSGALTRAGSTPSSTERVAASPTSGDTAFAASCASIESPPSTAGRGVGWAAITRRPASAETS